MTAAAGAAHGRDRKAGQPGALGLSRLLALGLALLLLAGCGPQNFTCHRDRLPPRGDLVCEPT